MAIESVHCPVLGAHVSRIINLEGDPVRVFCVEYEEPTGSCRRKRRALGNGPLSRLLERVSEETLDTRDTRCSLCGKGR